MTKVGALRDGLLQNWLRARDGVIGQVESLTDEQLSWSPGPGARQGIQIARHVADAGAGMVKYGTTGVRAHAAPTPDYPGTREEVLARLRAGRAEIEEALRAMPEADLIAPITGIFGNETDRLSFLNFAYGHEMYHWGQLGLCARGVGEIPELTRAIEARRKAAAPG